ncbi:MAG: hypothetical protein WB988_16000 [Candidatus Nitrosopolaris sp.]
MLQIKCTITSNLVIINLTLVHIKYGTHRAGYAYTQNSKDVWRLCHCGSNDIGSSSSSSALALRAGSTSQSVSKGKSGNSSSSATNTKPAKIIMMLQLMNENLLRAGKHREEAEEQEKQIREELEEIEWKMSAREHINYTTLDIEHDLPLPIINFRSKHS